MIGGVRILRRGKKKKKGMIEKKQVAGDVVQRTRMRPERDRIRSVGKESLDLKRRWKHKSAKTAMKQLSSPIY
jgi:hypothetical protein